MAQYNPELMLTESTGGQGKSPRPSASSFVPLLLEGTNHYFKKTYYFKLAHAANQESG